MASGEALCEPGCITSGRKTEEHKVFHRSVVSSGTPAVKERRYYEYKPISVLKTLCDVSRGVCEITVVSSGDNDKAKNDCGTCFLGQFDVDCKSVYGLFTANHVLGESDIHDCGTKVTFTYPGLDGRSPRSEDLNMQDSPYCFTCPLLNVTFIEFNEGLLSKLSQHGFDFLHVCTQWTGCVGAEFHLLHYPGALNDHAQYHSTGHLEQYNGLYLFHSASTKEGSSGAPVVIDNGFHVVAIHTAQSEDAATDYNVAVAAASVFQALIPYWKTAHSNPNQCRLMTHHPTENELMGLEEQLKGLRLEIQKARPKKGQIGHPRIPLYFTHPGLRVSDVEHTVLIHFVLTSHGWYWSEVAPDNGIEEPSWVPATRNVFGPGSRKDYIGKAVEDEPNGFSFAMLRTIGIRNLTSEFKQLSS